MPHSPRASGEIDARLGARVRELRKTRGVSQEQLAARLEVSPQQVFKYETGTNRISAVRLLQVATALDLPVTTFYPQNGQSPPDENRDLYEQIMLLEPTARMLVRDMISALAAAPPIIAPADGWPDGRASHPPRG